MKSYDNKRNALVIILITIFALIFPGNKISGYKNIYGIVLAWGIYIISYIYYCYQIKKEKELKNKKEEQLQDKIKIHEQNITNYNLWKNKQLIINKYKKIIEIIEVSYYPKEKTVPHILYIQKNKVNSRLNKWKEHYDNWEKLNNYYYIPNEYNNYNNPAFEKVKEYKTQLQNINKEIKDSIQEIEKAKLYFENHYQNVLIILNYFDAIYYECKKWINKNTSPTFSDTIKGKQEGEGIKWQIEKNERKAFINYYERNYNNFQNYRKEINYLVKRKDMNNGNN